jgi:hypothetical protein
MGVARFAVPTSALVLWLVVVLLWAPQLLVRVEGSLLASSRVERCVQDGATDVPTISCDRRMIVTLTVDSGQVRPFIFSSFIYLLRKNKYSSFICLFVIYIYISFSNIYIFLDLNCWLEQNNTEQLELVLDSTLDETGVLRTLEHPVQIQWAKTIPRLLYPITYVGVRFAPLSVRVRAFLK